MKRLALSAAGFSLLEMLTVISILSLLASVALPRYAAYIEKSQAAACFAQRKKAEEALALYNAEKPESPLPTLGGLVQYGLYSTAPLCPSGGVYVWVPVADRDLPLLYCSIHGYPGLSGVPASGGGKDKSKPEDPGKKPDAPPGLVK